LPILNKQINTDYNVYFTSEHTRVAACSRGHAGSVQHCL